MRDLLTIGLVLAGVPLLGLVLGVLLGVAGCWG